MEDSKGLSGSKGNLATKNINSAFFHAVK